MSQAASGRALRIGITIGLFAADESLWTNGIKQNALNLASVLKASPLGHTVHLVNTTAVPLTDALPWRLQEFSTLTFDDVKDELDVMIELGGGLDDAQSRHLKARGTRFVSYGCGSEYVAFLEAILFQRPLWPNGVYLNPHYDQLWLVPQVARSTMHYLKVIKRCSTAQVVPFVWNPRWLQDSVTQLPHQGQYQAGASAKRLVVMEPNHNVVKACVYPILIAEAAFRQKPERIAFLNVCNAQSLAESCKDFQHLMLTLDIVQANKATFLGKYQTAYFLSEHGDVVISNQWDNPLNYFYFDVCWLGYPLVHNASLCQDLGYYYPDNDVDVASERLLHVLEQHDEQASSYAARQRQLLRAYTPENAELVAEYDTLLAQLFRN